MGVLQALIETIEMPNYSEEQVKDIQDREVKAIAALKELQMTPAVSMQMVNIGNDQFAIKPVPYLQDLKYVSQRSPVQKEDLAKPE